MPKGAAYLEENEAEKKHPSSDEKGIISPGEISEYIFHQLSITRYNRVSLSISSLCSMDPSISNCNFKNLWSGEPTLHHKSLFKKKRKFSFATKLSRVESFPHCEIKMMSAQYTRWRKNTRASRKRKTNRRRRWPTWVLENSRVSAQRLRRVFPLFWDR